MEQINGTLICREICVSDYSIILRLSSTLLCCYRAAETICYNLEIYLPRVFISKKYIL